MFFSPGRTGSILIVKSLASQFNIDSVFGQNIHITTSHISSQHDENGPIYSVNNNKVIIHSHYPNLNLINKSEWVALISRRRNDFNCVISNIIANHTTEYYTYSNNLLPFHVPCANFINEYRRILQFYNDIDTTGFAKVFEVWSEDMLQYPKYLYNLFDINKSIDYNITNKSPYNETSIININELKILWQQNRFAHLNGYAERLTGHKR